MFQETVRFLLGGDFPSSKEEVNHQNRLAIHYFVLGGIPFAAVNIAAQAIVNKGQLPGLTSYWMIIYFVLVYLADRFIIPKKTEHATLLVYLLEAPVLLVSILLGTVWDPTHQAVTFFIFVMLTPVFILDLPIRAISVLFGWNALFIILCVAFKSPEVLGPDLIHAVEYLIAALMVTYSALKLRIEVVYSLERTRYHLEHDVLTNTRNRRSLETRTNRYLGSQVFVMVTDIDHFTMLSDFYGQMVGDSLMESYANDLKEVFGEGDTYRYGGDELLCVALGADEIEGLKLVEQSRSLLASFHAESVHTDITCSCGYVVGVPQNAHDLRRMIQLADIYAHKAKNQGEGKTVGGQFNEEALRAGIVESNITMHAKAHEVNKLTGLPSVSYFIARTTELLQHVADISRRPVVGYINVDRFHDFNDEQGYAKGDELIHDMSELLRDVLGKRHITYITGSQFAFLCYMDEVEPSMDRINESLSGYCPGHPLLAQAGFAEYHPGDTVISLLDKARLAHSHIEMGSWRMYDSRLDEEVRLRQHIVSSIDQAIDDGWLKVFYQPIVRADGGEVCALEALSRWDDPEFGALSPLDFVSILEEERLTTKFTLNVVRQVMADFARMEELGIMLVPASVNISRNDLFQQEFVEEVCAIVDEAGYPRDMLHIEITESAFIDNQDVLAREVDRFRDAGFSVWMDDFGSEYSTLNLLQELNFDVVKIDMRFMRNFSKNGRNAIIVADVIDMCRRMGIATLVEGVETKEHQELLCDMGCNMMQGYLFSRPQPLSTLIARALNTGRL